MATRRAEVQPYHFPPSINRKPRNPTLPIWKGGGGMSHTRRCDSCLYEAERNHDYGTFENCLTLTLTGGYGEFVDTWQDAGEELFLCHMCSHELMSMMFSRLDIKNWHPKTEDKYCNGWTMEDAQAFMTGEKQ
jgi:hypothetical protein